MHIKILVLGITGNLAELKILPGIAEFAEMAKKNNTTIELIGYSRSSPDAQRITDILNTHSHNNQHILRGVTFEQGEYNDVHIYHKIVEELQESEELWVYLAVPPSVYLSFLLQSTSYANHPVTICIEKPFGTNTTEMHRIYDVIQSHSLDTRVLFIDHYRYKAALFHEPRDTIQPAEICQVRAAALETLGIEDRLGYYASIGAVKDMLVHLISLCELQFSMLTSSNDPIQSVVISQAKLGQYHGITHKIPSTIPTYFSITGELVLKSDLTVEFDFTSGKKMSEKKTYVEFTTNAGKTYTWQLAPTSTYSDYQGSEAINVTIGDHARLFSSLLEKHYSHAITPGEALRYTILEDSVLTQLANLEGSSDFSLFEYPDHSTVN